MIKECKVLSYNKFLNILVFDYDGKQVQTTVILNDIPNIVFVEYKDEKYKIVNKNDYDKFIRELKKKDTSIKLSKKEKEMESGDVSE